MINLKKSCGNTLLTFTLIFTLTSCGTNSALPTNRAMQAKQANLIENVLQKGSNQATTAMKTMMVSDIFPSVTPPLMKNSVIPTDTDLTGYNGKFIGFFENKVFDNNPTELFAVDEFNDKTNDTARLVQAIRKGKSKKNGVVIILRAAKNSKNNRFSLAHIAIPSNTRIEVEPELVLEMRGVKEDSMPTGRPKNRPNKQFLFSFGRSNGPSRLIKDRVKNVEVRSTDPTRNFTIDAKTNMPFSYGEMVGGNGKGQLNLTRAIPFSFYFVENFAVSNVTIIDNHTESVSVQLAADRDYKDGAYAYRFKSKPLYLADRYVKNDKSAVTKPGVKPVVTLNKPMNPANITLPTNKNGDFIDANGKIIPDMFAIKRNPTYGRTPIKGSIKNIKASHINTGYGTVQVYGGDWVEIDNIEAFNGVGVRLEAGNGTNNDFSNRAGPYYTSMNNITISNVKVTNGFTGVWLKPHSKIMKNIVVENIEAIDSATALLVGKGAFACKTTCRDLTRGRINNLTVRGNITLRQTVYNKPVSEVGYVATFLISDANREYLAKKANKTITTISLSDFDNNVSGKRSFLMFPAAPILALSQMSATEIGDQSAKHGFYPVDYSQAKISHEGLALVEGEISRPNILYRRDIRMPNGNSGKAYIEK